MGLVVNQVETVQQVGQAPLAVRVAQKPPANPFASHQELTHDHEAAIEPHMMALAEQLQTRLPGRFILVQGSNVIARPAQDTGHQGGPHLHLVPRISQGAQQCKDLTGLVGCKDARVAAHDAGNTQAPQGVLNQTGLTVAAHNDRNIPGSYWPVANERCALFPLVQQPGDLPGNCRRHQISGAAHVKRFSVIVRRHVPHLQTAGIAIGDCQLFPAIRPAR